MPLYEGGCHCGRVRFQVTGMLTGVTDCNCSICTMKGFLHWIVPRDAFVLSSGEDALVTYEFNTGVAKHRFCRFCGIHPFYVPRSDPDKIDVNVRCLRGVDLAALVISPFDGKNWEQSMAGPVPWRTPGSSFVVVATLSVRRQAVEQFHTFERVAATVMRRYGGAIERRIAVTPSEGPLLEEIHVVTFPDAEAFAAYRRDPELLAAAPLREAAIASTRMVIGEEGVLGP